MFFLILASLQAKNIGHRLGGDIYPPENTLYAYEKLLKTIDKAKDVEFDVRETKDHQLVVFHDEDLSRVVPKSLHNIAILKTMRFKTLKIQHLTLEQLKKLNLLHDAKIPTLEEVLQASGKWHVKKPLHVEVKLLHSDNGREKFIQTLIRHKKKLNLMITIFRKNFLKSFPYPKRWLSLLKKHGIKMYQIDRYEYTQSIGDEVTNMDYKIILSEKKFAINAKRKRTIHYPFDIPKNIDSVLIGIYHAKDNTGDKGLFVKVKNKHNKLLFYKFVDQRYWKWLAIDHLDAKRYTLILEDNDTKLTGGHPGNGGIIKIIGLKKSKN